MNAPLPLHVAPLASSELRVQVRAMRLEAEGILAFELADPQGAELPEVEAGAHVDVRLPNGLVRSYSLAGAPSERSRWTLGVLHEAKGRGGSRAMHERVRVGDILTLAAPRNHFALAPDASRSILLAGGIGITPLKSMAHELARQGRPFELHYCTRSRRHAAFLDELAALAPPGSLHLHFDGGDPARGLDIAHLLAPAAAGTHLYYCGPAGFMKACAEASAHWPAATVHCEHFKAPEPTAAQAPAGGFEVRLARSGVTLQVQPEQTIVRAIELAGLRVPTSCLSGLCGTCKVGYLEGEVEHHDYILSEEEQRRCLTVCVSRARSASLVLDL